MTRDTREFNDTRCDCRDCTMHSETPNFAKDPPSPVSPHRTPWAVHCRGCGLVHLSHHEYTRQMNRSNTLWVCPNCRENAQWSDEEYEAYGEVLQDAYERSLTETYKTP
jgi:hypothetical protein